MKLCNLMRASLLLLVFHVCTSSLHAQRSDTLYFNSSWEITEKPFASYYRFGKIMIDTFWFYSGRVMDYYMNGTMQMDGSYSSLGEKNGHFYFFFENGKPMSKGMYENNRRMGVWEYFYSDGKLQARVDYSDGIHFTVIDYFDESGKILAKEGTGSFSIYLIAVKGPGGYRVEGEFKNGKKAGTWKFYAINPFNRKEDMLIKEIFENGGLKKGFLYNSFSGGVYETYKKERYIYTIPEYDKLTATESFTKDKTIFTNTKDDQDLLDYLAKREAPSFTVEGESFQESFVGMLKTLNTFSITRYFDDPRKIYNGYVQINVSDSGDIEEIEVTGNLTEKEKEYMIFFIKKFRNIHEIIIENVGVDAYHKIYFFTVLFEDFFPKQYLQYMPKSQFFFSILPYDKLQEAVKEAIKRKKKKNKKD